MDTRTKSIRILMFPWLAHGHISPYLELAKKLASRNFYIYICSSPLNLDSIKKNLSEKESISIKLVELHIPASLDLPPEYHTTNGLPQRLMRNLKKALDLARPSFSTTLRTLKPDLVLYDFLHPFAPEESLLQNIPAVMFYCSGAATLSFCLHPRLNPNSSEFPFSVPFLRDDEREIYNRKFLAETNDSARFLDCLQRSSDIVLIKSFRDFEGKYIDYCSSLGHKKFVPVGSLVEGTPALRDEYHNDIIQWLNQKSANSTMFAYFGSEYFLSDDDIETIAYGLELSGVNFIWALRFPKDENIKISEKLPEGFLERVGNRGMVVEWAPQGRILVHPSTGGFASHCGWSSVMEAMYFGVPVVALPMQFDRLLNAKLMEAMGVGEEVVRDGEGRLDREVVARAIRGVVVEEEGEKLRRKVKEMSEKLRGNGQEEIDGAVEEMVKLCKKSEEMCLSPANSMNKLDDLLIANREGLVENTLI